MSPGDLTVDREMGLGDFKIDRERSLSGFKVHMNTCYGNLRVERRKKGNKPWRP